MKKALSSLYVIILFLAGCTIKVDINDPPKVQILSGPSGNVSGNSFTFTFQGTDTDGTISGYYIGLDNENPQNWTTETSATYNNLSTGQHTFYVQAKDNDDALSSIASRTFTIISSSIANVYISDQFDEDGDGYYNQIQLNWDVSISYNTSVYAKIYALSSTMGVDRTFYIGRTNDYDVSSNDDNGYHVVITNIPYGEYDFRIELYHTSDNNLLDTYTNLTIKLENDMDDYFFWAWVDHKVDNDGDNYYESIRLNWDADCNIGSDDIYIKIYQKHNNIEDLLYTTDIYTINDDDADDYHYITINGADDKGYYSYKLELYDSNDDLMDVIDYELINDLTNIPLDNTKAKNRIIEGKNNKSTVIKKSRPLFDLHNFKYILEEGKN